MKTQLTSAKNYDVNRLIFSKVNTSKIPNSTLDSKRIFISTRNPDGTIGDLILKTAPELFSYGVSANLDPNTQKITGYSFPICMWNKEGPTEEEAMWTDTWQKIIQKCKDHLIEHQSEFGRYDLEMAELKSFDKSLFWKRDKSNGKIIPNVGPTLYCKLIISKKDGFETIQSFFNDATTGEVIDPMTLQQKYCYTQAAIKIESIFIGNKISIQVKLWEACVSVIDRGMKRLLEPTPRVMERVVPLLETLSAPVVETKEEYPAGEESESESESEQEPEEKEQAVAEPSFVPVVEPPAFVELPAKKGGGRKKK